MFARNYCTIVPGPVSEEALTLSVASESTLRAIVYVQFPRGEGGGGLGVLGEIFAGYVPLASQSPLPHYSLFFCGQL